MPPIEIDFATHGRFTREWLEEHADDAQTLLAQFHGGYPICRCRSPGLPLYISLRAHRYYLARLPNTGPEHAVRCPSFEPDRASSGWAFYAPSALELKSDGQIGIRLGVSLSIRGGHEATTQAAPSTPTARAARTHISLRGLLHLLVERAEFHRWTPRMQQRRRYRQLHKFFWQAAESIAVRGAPLTKHLFIPEPFDASIALEIAARRQRALRDRCTSANGTPLRVLIFGEVRQVHDDAEHRGLSLAHLPGKFLFRAEADLLARLQRETDFLWLDWPAMNPGLRLLVLLTTRPAHPLRWIIDEVKGLVTTSDYIPVLTIEEAMIAQRLVQGERQFIKPLPYDGQAARLPSFLLTDCETDAPVPLEIVGATPGDIAIQQLRLADYTRSDRTYWQWSPQASGTPPEFTPRSE